MNSTITTGRRWPPPPWVYLALGFLTLAVFGQTVRHEFVNYDDFATVRDNPLLREPFTPRGLEQVFLRFHQGNWFPLTWLSQMLDWRLYGDWAGGHHLTNVLLHLLAVCLLYAALTRLTAVPGPSGIVAALFAVHPLRVEAVAWISTRKDVLSGAFFGLALLAYAAYVRRPNARRYALLSVAFFCGLMSKSTLVTLPCVLLLFDYWPLRRISGESRRDRIRCAARLVLEKVPLFALSGLSSILTFFAQREGGSVASMEQFSFGVRLANAAIAYVRYVAKTLLPVRLAPIYPHPGDTVSVGLAAVCAVSLFVVSLLIFLARRRRPYLLTGWFMFLGMLVPMIGLVQVGSQALADRYMYLPQIGLFVAIVWAANDLFSAVGIARGRRAAGLAAASAAIAACAALSFAQVRHWRDSIALFEHTLRVTSFNGIAHANLGLALIERGRYAEAEQHFRAILDVVPDDPTALANLGATLVRQGRCAEAEPPLRRALAAQPDNPKIMGSLGVALSLTGRAQEALPLFERVIELGNDSAESRLNYAVALANTGQIERAREQARAALAMDANYEKAKRFLDVLAERGAAPPRD